MRIVIGVIVTVLVIAVAFGIGFLGVFGESSSTTTAGPPPVHNAVFIPKTAGPDSNLGTSTSSTDLERRLLVD